MNECLQHESTKLKLKRLKLQFNLVLKLSVKFVARVTNRERNETLSYVVVEFDDEDD